MAKARKCDRCGCCFDPLDMGKEEMLRFQNPIFQTAESIRETRIHRKLLNDEPSETWIDFCTKCTKDFEAFMDKQNPFYYRTPELKGAEKHG